MEQNISNDNFKLWTKWFWIGIVIAILSMVSGIVYGIALSLEKDYRKEGIIIIVVAIAWFLFAMFILGPWLKSVGVLPNYQLLQIR
ncbi:hypothetical protein KKG24_01240 [Patescibacteria group bacterium]|nr:hypothetical protein [Patescibacteria group bacterium]